MLNILDKLFNETIEPLRNALHPASKKYEIKTPQSIEKKLSPESREEFKTLKNYLLKTIHEEHIFWLKKQWSNFDNDTKKELNDTIINASLFDVPQETISQYTQWAITYYNIFKKFLSWKQNIKTKELAGEKLKLNIGQIKDMIKQGKSLGDIADYYKMPKSTLAFKLKSLFQTSYTQLKKSIPKSND
jgi:hypothetical protein